MFDSGLPSGHTESDGGTQGYKLVLPIDSQRRHMAPHAVGFNNTWGISYLSLCLYRRLSQGAGEVGGGGLHSQYSASLGPTEFYSYFLPSILFRYIKEVS